MRIISNKLLYINNLRGLPVAASTAGRAILAHQLHTICRQRRWCRAFGQFWWNGRGSGFRCHFRRPRES